jgi:hypothetical protein
MAVLLYFREKVMRTKFAPDDGLHPHLQRPYRAGISGKISAVEKCKSR